MKLTAATVTDAQIRELGTQLVAAGAYCAAMWCDYALIADRDCKHYDIPRGCDRYKARARCAELINARNPS
jgi:hypothetical protein